MFASLDLPVWLSLSVFIAIAFVATTQFLRLNHALNSIPGPSVAAWTPLWMVYRSRKGDMHRTMIDLHSKYGKLVRTGPNEVSVSDLAAIRTIYSVPIYPKSV